jgi:hypothetical protein
MKPLLFLAFAGIAAAQTTGSAIPFVKSQFFTNGGLPAAGYKACFYLAGTTTPSVTYTTSAVSVANANPVVLDSSGRADIFLAARLYKVTMLLPASTTTNCTTGTMSAIWTEDNIGNNADLQRAALLAAGGANLIGYQPQGAAAILGLSTVGSVLDRTGYILDTSTYTAPSAFPNACTAAGAAGKSLSITTVHTSLTAGATYACDLWFLKGGTLQIPTGAAVTFTGNVYCPPTQTCFDTTTNAPASVIFTAARKDVSVFTLMPVCSATLGLPEGSQWSVTNAGTNVWGDVVTGAGALHIRAYCNGTAWTVMGK